MTTPAGTSDPTPSSANTFTVRGRLTLIPTFQQLAQGGEGGLSIEITTPAPAGGLAITLTSGNTNVATLPSPVTIPAGAMSLLIPVSAVGEGSTTLSASAPGYAPATAAVTVILPPPTLTSFSPTSGKVGVPVTLTGGPFSTVNPSGNTVTFPGPDSTRLPAPATTLSSTQLSTTVPAGAVTGPLQVITAGGTATSSGHFIVLPSQDFTLTAVPATATALQGSQAIYALSVSGAEGFTGLVSLALTGLPPGVSATFTPPTLAPGQHGTLTLTVGGGVATGSVPLTLTGSSTIDGALRSHSTALTLAIAAGGRTALTGQILVVDGTPLPGVRLSLAGQTTFSVAAGAFQFLDVPAGTQMLSIDAHVARSGFPIYGVDVTLTAGQMTVLPPFKITPPPPPERFTPITNSTQAQVITDPRFPGASITLPAGVTITGWDGTGGGSTTYLWDTRDRLVALTGPAISTTFRYDPTDRRTHVNSVAGEAKPARMLSGGARGPSPGDRSFKWESLLGAVSVCRPGACRRRQREWRRRQRPFTARHQRPWSTYAAIAFPISNPRSLSTGKWIPDHRRESFASCAMAIQRLAWSGK